MPATWITIESPSSDAARAAFSQQGGFAGPGGFAESGPVFGFREAVADSLDLATEHTGAKEGAIGPANQVAHAVRMGQPESRRQLPKRHGRQLPRQPGGQIPAHRAAALPQDTGTRPWCSAAQTMLIGGVAATAAFLIARVFS